MRRGCGHRFCGAFALLPLHPRLQGGGNMAGARFLCVASCSRIVGRGCEHDPCADPRAQPLHAPPFACHPAHADASVAPERWGAGVVHAGSCSHAVREGPPLPLGAPQIACTRVLRDHIARAPAGRKGGRAEPRGTPRTRMEGGVPATPAACPLPPSRPLLAPPGPCSNGKGREIVPRARVSGPCWGANEASVCSQTGARPGRERRRVLRSLSSST